MKDFHKKALKDIKLWAWAATVLPIVAIAAISFAYLIGFSSWIEILLVVISTIVFATAVIWWWWALHTIAGITGILSAALGKFEKVEDEVSDLRTDLENQQRENDNFRKRRK
jgi:hypothetical protein|tara:strand:- start:864 stop:1199 length:336 start_codon:yes stop_codon:yes gene_type:complete